MKNNEVKMLPTNTVRVSDITEEKIPLNIESTGVQAKWKKGYTGKGVVVAVLDTGCNTIHPDLKERIIGGYNFTEEHNGDISIYEDLNGHGTHVAGIIAGSINQTGILGIAPKANLLILKVLNSRGSGSVESLVDAIHYAIDWRGLNGERVRVISLSLGLRNTNQKLYNAILRAIENNISVVSASGNNGDGNINTHEYRYPGAYEEVIEVGAIDSNSEIAHFSNTNEFIDIYAPGVGIYSSTINGEYTQMSGTSMATPHISGCIALLIEEFEYLLARTITEQDVYNILIKHTTTSYVDNRRINIIALNALNRISKLAKREVVHNGSRQ